MRRFRNAIIVSILAILLLSGMIFSIYLHGQASVIGSRVGEVNGKIVGTAIGSARGITNGIEQGAEDGANAGLSAEDTTAHIAGMLKSTGKLEVLTADVSLKNINKIGEAYQGLYLISGNAVFTVDLSETTISHSTDFKDIYIHIPFPCLELYLDQNSTEKLAEIQHFDLTVDAKDGLISQLNTMSKTVETVKDSMANYDLLMNTAKEYAINQVQQLAETICGNTRKAHVIFNDGGK